MSEKAPQASIADLVQHFFDEADEALGSWLLERGGRRTRELTHVNPAGKLECTTPAAIYGFFSAVVDFETPNILGTFSFGDRELCIDAVATPSGRPDRYSLADWAAAADRAELVPRNTAFVLQLDRMSDIVRSFAMALRELEPLIAEAATPTLDRISAIRAISRSAQEAEWREAQHRATVHLADEAFQRRDWPRVATLLESVRDRLTRAERAKLAYAKRRTT